MIRLLLFYFILFHLNAVSAIDEQTVGQVQKKVLAKDASQLRKVLNIKDMSDIKYIRKLSAPLSGTNVFKVMHRNDTPYVLKWLPKSRVNSVYEVNMQSIAASHNLAAEIYYRDDIQRMFVMEYLYNSKVPQGKYGRNLLQEFLNDIHMVDIEKNIMQHKDIYKLLAQNVKILQEMNILDNTFLTKFKTVLAAGVEEPLKLSKFTHNQLNLDNIFFYKKHFKAISWQQAGIGDPYYDIASILVWFLPSMANHGEFLSSYYGYPASDVQVQRLLHIEKLVKAYEASKILLHLARSGEAMVVPHMTGTKLADYLLLLHSGGAKLDSNYHLARFVAIIMNSLNV